MGNASRREIRQWQDQYGSKLTFCCCGRFSTPPPANINHFAMSECLLWSTARKCLFTLCCLRKFTPHCWLTYKFLIVSDERAQMILRAFKSQKGNDGQISRVRFVQIMADHGATDEEFASAIFDSCNRTKSGYSTKQTNSQCLFSYSPLHSSSKTTHQERPSIYPAHVLALLLSLFSRQTNIDV